MRRPDVLQVDGALAQIPVGHGARTSSTYSSTTRLSALSAVSPVRDVAVDLVEEAAVLEHHAVRRR